MVSFMATSSHFILSSHPVGHCPDFPSLPFLNHPRRQPPCVSFSLPPAIECGSMLSCCSEKRSLGPRVLLFQRNYRSGLVRRCKSWETEGDAVLEAEILEFMGKSDTPAVFPTKKELIDAGRMDLVETIAKRGGWFALGWDMEEEELAESESVQEDEFQGSISLTAEEIDDGSVHSNTRRSLKQRADGNNESLSIEGIKVGRSEVAPSSSSPSYLASASDGSPQTEAGVEAGIEGILSRLENERSLRFGVDSRAKESRSTSDVKYEEEDDAQPKVSADAVTSLGRSSRSTYLSTSKEFQGDTRDLHIQNSYFLNADGIGSSFKPEMRRKWSTQRAAFSNAQFEAFDFVPSESRAGKIKDDMDNEMFTKVKDANDTNNVLKDPVSGDKMNGPNHIRSRLQNLEAELASVLHLLRSNADALHKDHESSLEELQRLPDDWEFQETTIMKTQNKLRSTRAKLAVLEGKIALSISEAQKMVDEKQRRIDSAQRALLLLRTACIIWPMPASEVLLAGSFDGWASQRRMERSSGGIFSLCLKLYPGIYEIKFIVDGVWKIDQLRPIVHNNGYENNLLIVHKCKQ
ncbi:protein PTST homolog 2, chloroplastic-like [Telopea speciosissima]|uniref:protein PTST homolog 2, chloroplastic-like n=1 Tax=Telopea speciosissima TaxID=54955 RepID=UPI001CC5D391|nr:protein PTST homolog 2, chloroplastic-like [Telopea speciosissima]